MHVVVGVKRVPSPEASARALSIDPRTGRIVADGVPHVMGPYDENALEVALRLKDNDPAVRVTAVTYGPPEADDILRRALAAGADEAIRIEDDAAAADDPWAAGEVLAQAIRRLAPVDLALFGRLSGDGDSGQTPFVVAERLGWPAVSAAAAAVPAGEQIVVRRVLEDAVEELSLALPAVLVVTNDGLNALRVPRLKSVLAARRRPIPRWTPFELDASPASSVPIRVVELVMPRSGACTFVEGSSDAEKGERLAEEMVRRGWL
jgi:electron transfer flavoprotein beta subunit